MPDDPNEVPEMEQQRDDYRARHKALCELYEAALGRLARDARRARNAESMAPREAGGMISAARAAMSNAYQHHLHDRVEDAVKAVRDDLDDEDSDS